jgi:LPXTG-motif cell wall-anchored protein
VLLLSTSIALLLARVVALLLAADPSQPFVQLLQQVTAPLLIFVRWIDRNQPTTGVRFERGTLGLAGLLLIGTILMLLWQRRRKDRPDE